MSSVSDLSCNRYRSVRSGIQRPVLRSLAVVIKIHPCAHSNLQDLPFGCTDHPFAIDDKRFLLHRQVDEVWHDVIRVETHSSQALSRRSISDTEELRFIHRIPNDRYHRRRRGPSLEPTKAHSAISPPYQIARNGRKSSGQWNA